MRQVTIIADGRWSASAQQLAVLLHKSPGAVHAQLRRHGPHGMWPSGHVDPRTPVYGVADLGIDDDGRMLAGVLAELLGEYLERAPDVPPRQRAQLVRSREVLRGRSVIPAEVVPADV